jgi:hypothetical protein
VPLEWQREFAIGNRTRGDRSFAQFTMLAQ